MREHTDGSRTPEGSRGNEAGMRTVALLREGTYLLLLSALICMFWRADIVGVRTHAI